MDRLYLRIFDVSIAVRSEHPKAAWLLEQNYGALMATAPGEDGLFYTVRATGTGEFRIEREGTEPLLAPDVGDFLFEFEKDMTLELQRRRPDLYFLHAAALACGDKGCMLVAPSGSGKSTTAWGLLRQGFAYLSDELAPLALQDLEIQPYPHALCLKKEPPGPDPLPSGTLRTARTLHVPVRRLPGEVRDRPVRLAAIFFLSHHPEAHAPALREITVAEAAARLYSNALNALAHTGAGLDGAIEIAHRCRSFEVHTAELRATARLLRAVMEDL